MQGRSTQANLPEEDSTLPVTGLRKRVSLRSPVRKNRTPGSVRGASGNRRPYRDGSQPVDRREAVSYDLLCIPSACVCFSTQGVRGTDHLATACPGELKGTISHEGGTTMKI